MSHTLNLVYLFTVSTFKCDLCGLLQAIGKAEGNKGHSGVKCIRKVKLPTNNYTDFLYIAKKKKKKKKKVLTI